MCHVRLHGAAEMSGHERRFVLRRAGYADEIDAAVLGWRVSPLGG